MCVDNDDGSSYYNIYNNFEIYGGHKSDFGGHNKFTHDSVVAMAQDYQSGLCGDFGRAVPGFVDGYYNNSCIQAAVVPYVTLMECDLTDPTAKVIFSILCSLSSLVSFLLFFFSSSPLVAFPRSSFRCSLLR